MTIRPINLEPLAFGEQNAHLFRGNGNTGKRAVAFVLGGLLIFADEADAFVAHEYSLQFTVDNGQDATKAGGKMEAARKQVKCGSLLITESRCYGALQKNHAAMERPMKTTRPRRRGCGTRRAMLAEVYPPMAQVTMARRQ